jgi:predicted nucleic-acid-binding protein
MSNIKQFQPICLLNVSFKIFTKVTISRLTQVVDKLISQSQTVFVPSRNIIEGVVVLHETIHELHRKKMNGVILKLNFKKAYDKMK